MKQNKYEYVKVIQVHTNYGWEDASEYDDKDFKNARADLREYRASKDGLEYRLINRRNPVLKVA